MPTGTLNPLADVYRERDPFCSIVAIRVEDKENSSFRERYVTRLRSGA